MSNISPFYKFSKFSFSAMSDTIATNDDTIIEDGEDIDIDR